MKLTPERVQSLHSREGRPKTKRLVARKEFPLERTVGLRDTVLPQISAHTLKCSLTKEDECLVSDIVRLQVQCYDYHLAGKKIFKDS